MCSWTLDSTLDMAENLQLYVMDLTQYQTGLTVPLKDVTNSWINNYFWFSNGEHFTFLPRFDHELKNNLISAVISSKWHNEQSTPAWWGCVISSWLTLCFVSHWKKRSKRLWSVPSSTKLLPSMCIMDQKDVLLLFVSKLLNKINRNCLICCIVIYLSKFN